MQLNKETLQTLTDVFSEWSFVIALVILTFELIRFWVKKTLNRDVLQDVVACFSTFGFFLLLEYFLYFTFYITVFYTAAEFTPFQIPINLWSCLIVLILADLAYYCEHRFSHRVGFAWASHAVHHSSEQYNISVAYRFGPLDGILSLPFYLPLVLMGFDPLLVLLAEVIVLEYQTLLHTELVNRLPRWFEAVFNTPSHHRVHHGSNPQYLDKNYAGMFIVWDKLFGTFEAEEEKVVYGLTKPINTANPFKVFTINAIELVQSMWQSGSYKNAWGHFIRPPGWMPKD